MASGVADTSSSVVYLCLVYENYRHYRDYNKFHEICLTLNQVLIKEKYIHKDEYIIEFHQVPTGFGERVYEYIKDKFIKTLFPFNVKKGELQSVCIEFINKCREIQQEKSKLIEPLVPSASPSPPQLLLGSAPSMPIKLIALIQHSTQGGIAVVTNNNTLTPNEMYQQLCQQYAGTLQVLQYTTMTLEEVNAIIDSFHKDFHFCRLHHNELGLSWYKTTEAEVIQWLQKKNAKPPSPSTASIHEQVQQSQVQQQLQPASPISPSTIEIDDMQDVDISTLSANVSCSSFDNLFSGSEYILSGTADEDRIPSPSPFATAFMMEKKKRKQMD